MNADTSVDTFEVELWTATEAMNWWLIPRDHPSPHVERERAHALIAERRPEIKLRGGHKMLPILWLRLFLSAGLPTDPDGISELQGAERERQARDEILLYQGVKERQIGQESRDGRMSTVLEEKTIGPAPERFKGRGFKGLTTLELLLIGPQGPVTDRNRWPYMEKWVPALARRDDSSRKAGRPLEYFEKKWPRPTAALQAALKIEISQQRGHADELISMLKPRQVNKRYKSEFTKMELATRLQRKYPAMKKYTVKTLTEVLPAFVKFNLGRPASGPGSKRSVKSTSGRRGVR